MILTILVLDRPWIGQMNLIQIRSIAIIGPIKSKKSGVSMRNGSAIPIALRMLILKTTNWSLKLFPKLLLKGKTVRLVVTADTVRWYDYLFMRSPLINQFKKGTLEFCGVKPVKISYIAPIKDSTIDFRKYWLKRMTIIAENMLAKHLTTTVSFIAFYGKAKGQKTIFSFLTFYNNTFEGMKVADFKI